MNPTDDRRPGREGSPTVREIAEFTARLRDLSARGRSADPRERAAFLADKHALLARITDSQHDDRQRGDHGGDGRPEPVGDVQMPEWMREQAARSEAAIAAGTALPVRGDDRAELAVRIEALREQVGHDATDPPAYARECERPPRAVPSCLVDVDDEQQEARREQLACWNADDTAANRDEALADMENRFILVDGTEQP